LVDGVAGALVVSELLLLLQAARSAATSTTAMSLQKILTFFS
jgi:hypothetical protein